MERGVKVVGAVPGDDKTDDKADDTDEDAPVDGTDAAAEPPRPPTKRRPGGSQPGPSRKTLAIVGVVAALGLLGTLIFGVLYATKSSGQIQDPAVLTASRTFLTDFFNFNAKTVDSDFNAITNMATGQFSSQATQFFNSNIRKALESALAESRGQIRYLEVQSEGNPPGTASIYAVIDQTYVNNKISTPQRRRPPHRRAPAGRRGLEDLQRDRARGRHARQRLHRQLRIGLGRLERPRPVAGPEPGAAAPPPTLPVCNDHW